MSTTPFLTTGDFTYSARVTPVALRQGALNLRITTRWATSRTPDAENVAFNVTLKPEELKALIAVLQDGLATAEASRQDVSCTAAC